jgi:hypothetical protein
MQGRWRGKQGHCVEPVQIGPGGAQRRRQQEGKRRAEQRDQSIQIHDGMIREEHGAPPEAPSGIEK